MTTRKIGHIFLLIFVFGTLFILRNDLAYSLGLLKRFVTTHTVTIGDGALIRVIEKETVFNPGALKVSSAQQNTNERIGVLQNTFAQEIFDRTNSARTEVGLSKLVQDNALQSMAEMKVADMVEKHYFEHVSPTGESIKDIAKKSEYQYAIIGENLALSDTVSAKEIVDAWLNSPGHRANILHKGYTAIGVAIGKTTIDGISHIVAVQHFATPISKCPQVNTFLKTTIANKQKEVDALKKQITEIEFQIKNTTETGESELRKTHTSLVTKYNTQMSLLKKYVDEYNIQVKRFNDCVQKL